MIQQMRRIATLSPRRKHDRRNGDLAVNTRFHGKGDGLATSGWLSSCPRWQRENIEAVKDHHVVGAPVEDEWFIGGT